MSEAEILSGLFEVNGLLYDHLTLFASVIFAYVVGLYYFIGRAQIVFKSLVFSFFLTIYVVLTLMAVGLINYFDLHMKSLQLLAEQGELSIIGESIGPGNLPEWQNLFLFSVVSLVILAALTYLTFFYRWTDEGKQEPAKETTEGPG